MSKIEQFLAEGRHLSERHARHQSGEVKNYAVRDMYLAWLERNHTRLEDLIQIQSEELARASQLLEMTRQTLAREGVLPVLERTLRGVRPAAAVESRWTKA